MTGRQQLAAMALGLHIVEIDGKGIEQGRHYTDKATGTQKPLPGRQDGYLFQGDPYPIKLSIDIPEGKSPYRPGLYALTGAIFESGKFGRAEFRGFRSMQLIELSEAAQALADLAAVETGAVVDLPASKPKAA